MSNKSNLRELEFIKVCTVQIAARGLEKSDIYLYPDQVFMEGETVLTQYIIPYWDLDYTNTSNTSYIS